jgi:hypothetical protein
MGNLKHWLPLIIAISAFLVSGLMGGLLPEDINFYDWLAAAMALGSAFSIRYLIPEDRGRLRVFSMIVAVTAAFFTVSYLMSMCVDTSQLPQTTTE